MENRSPIELAFAPALFDDVVAGRKKITIRHGRRNHVELGAAIAAEPREGDEDVRTAPIEVTSVRFCRLRHLTRFELADDGMANVEDARRVLAEFYPAITLDDVVTVVRFRLAQAEA